MMMNLGKLAVILALAAVASAQTCSACPRGSSSKSR
jgi:hypothetical protein